jgi:hypothetical protein
MSTCNWLDLQTLGSQPIMPKNLPKHRLVVIARRAFNRELDSDSMFVL